MAMTIKVTTLTNGLRVASDTIAGMESVSIGFWLGVGTRHEPDAANGVAHLVEHMLFKGTPTRDSFAISSAMEDVGGHLNAYTTRESTAYYAKVLKADVNLAADVLSDMLLHASLDETELARERGVILQEIGQSLDQPDDVVFDLLAKQTYPHSGMGKPILGTAEIIRSLPRPAMQAYIQDHYTARQTVFAAAGAIEHEALVALAEKHLAAMPSGVIAGKTTEAFHSGDAREQREIEQLHAVISFKSLPYHAPEYYALQVLSTLLGGGMSSRLFQEVREKRGLVYSISSYVSAHSDGGQFGIYAGTDPERIEELLPVVAEQLLLVTKEVREEELNRAKAQLRASLFMMQESNMARAERLSYNLLCFNRIVPSQEVMDKINAVTLDSIHAIARTLLAHPPATAFVGPLAKVAEGDRIAGLFKL